MGLQEVEVDVDLLPPPFIPVPYLGAPVEGDQGQAARAEHAVHLGEGARQFTGFQMDDRVESQYSTVAVGLISPRVTRSIRPAIDFPSYTGSVIMPSVRAATRIASSVAASGMPYVPNGYKRVAPLGQGVGDQVFQLPRLVAAVGDAGVAVLRLAQIGAPPRCRVSRSNRCTGEGPNSRGYFANDSSGTAASQGRCGFNADLQSARQPRAHRQPRPRQRIRVTPASPSSASKSRVGPDHRPIRRSARARYRGPREATTVPRSPRR